jgi:hypothetical protein
MGDPFDTREMGVAGGGNNFDVIDDMFNSGISKLGKNAKNIDNDELLKIIANDEFLLGLIPIVAQDIAKAAGKSPSSAIDAIRRMPCKPKDCAMGGVAKEGADGMLEFFKNFENIAKHKYADNPAVTMTDEAYGSLATVVNNMGQLKKSDNGYGHRHGASKGATNAFAKVAQRMDSGEYKRFDGAEIKIDVKGTQGNHQFDSVFTQKGDDGLTIHFEDKDWGEKTLGYVTSSLKGVIDGASEGQLHLDLISLLRRGMHKPDNIDNVDIRWDFTNGDPNKIVEKLSKYLLTTSGQKTLKEIAEKSGDASIVSSVNKGKSKEVVDEIITPLLDVVIMKAL